MTIVAYDGREMAADSGCWSGGREQTVPFPKITRAPDGSLLAASGKLADSWHTRQWTLAGMPSDAKPTFEGTGDDEPYIIMVKPDGSCWFAKGSLSFTPEPYPVCTGEGNASHFCEGAMAAGKSASEAIALTIKNHQSAAGPVQIEYPRHELMVA